MGARSGHHPHGSSRAQVFASACHCQFCPGLSQATLLPGTESLRLAFRSVERTSKDTIARRPGIRPSQRDLLTAASATGPANGLGMFSIEEALARSIGSWGAIVRFGSE